MANQHKLTMENRSRLVITDVRDVYSFDDHIINLHIGEENDLMISGDGLSITKLSLDNPEGGEVVICGTVEAVVYSESGRNSKNASKPGRLQKLFK
ncbi:MAG: hypothetical protein A2Y17_00300 [Clostridiales bacterium GWF2_38_85]|nr:MAG: hypothetical protein A2Y17_00300 [Clostridiales bacterium GWF2_38_85]HBL83901.1 hypothetical protein [Clostridiales bacterium]